MKKTEANGITATQFDALVASPGAGAGIVWTAKGIGEKIGRTEQWVRKVLAKADGSPVQHTSTGQLYAVEADLRKYFTTAEHRS